MANRKDAIDWLWDLPAVSKTATSVSFRHEQTIRRSAAQ
jgi:hypothetical protein